MGFQYTKGLLEPIKVKFNQYSQAFFKNKKMIHIQEVNITHQKAK